MKPTGPMKFSGRLQIFHLHNQSTLVGVPISKPLITQLHLAHCIWPTPLSHSTVYAQCFKSTNTSTNSEGSWACLVFTNYYFDSWLQLGWFPILHAVYFSSSNALLYYTTSSSRIQGILKANLWFHLRISAFKLIAVQWIATKLVMQQVKVSRSL